MPNTLHDPRIAVALDRMFACATRDEAASRRLGPAADFATSTAAEQGTRHRTAGADEEEDALAEALRDAPSGTFPQIAALGAELMSGTGPDRLTWGFRVLISGITQTPRLEERPGAGR